MFAVHLKDWWERSVQPQGHTVLLFKTWKIMEEQAVGSGGVVGAVQSAGPSRPWEISEEEEEVSILTWELVLLEARKS